MKVWELIAELEKMPAGAEVINGDGEDLLWTEKGRKMVVLEFERSDAKS